MKCSGEMYWSRNKRLPPGFQCLIHRQVAQLHPAVEEVQPCFHQVQEKGQGPEILCHWPGIGRPSEVVIVQLNPWASLVSVLAQLAYCSQLHSSQLWATVPHPCLGPHCCEACVAATEREHANRQGE